MAKQLSLFPKSYYLGIDPGISGALTLLDSDSKMLRCDQFPTVKEKSRTGRNLSRLDIPSIAQLFKEVSDVEKGSAFRIMIEKQIAMPGQNAIGTFNTGKGYGILLALISVFFPGAEVIEVLSKDWQNALITKRTEVKSKLRRDKRKQLKLDSIAAAEAEFPDADFRKTEKSKVKSDGKADSALIARYIYLLTNR